MSKREELDLFLTRADEFIESKYILADVKIINLLKSIASSDTLIAIFKNCLDGFDYEKATKTYHVANKYLSGDKGEFVLPSTSRELLAFIFNLLVDIDAKRIDFSGFIKRYFYEDGSFSAGYSAFINAMIKPFKNSVKMLMESVIEGKLQDPVEALTEEENRKREEEILKAEREKKEKELLTKVYGESVKRAKELLLDIKLKVKASKLKDVKKDALILVIDMLANTLDSEDKDAITYAFVSFNYASKVHKKLLRKHKKIEKLVKAILNAI